MLFPFPYRADPPQPANLLRYQAMGWGKDKPFKDEKRPVIKHAPRSGIGGYPKLTDYWKDRSSKKPLDYTTWPDEVEIFHQDFVPH